MNAKAHRQMDIKHGLPLVQHQNRVNNMQKASNYNDLSVVVERNWKTMIYVLDVHQNGQ